MTLTVIVVLLLAYFAHVCWQTLREWDARRFPADRWFGRCKATSEDEVPF